MKALLVFVTTYSAINVIPPAACLSLIPNTLLNAVKGERKQFLEKIKEDLRKDNDDYKEFNSSYVYNNITTPPLTAASPAPAGDDIRVLIRSPYASTNQTRRLSGDDSSGEAFYTDTNRTTDKSQQTPLLQDTELNLKYDDKINNYTGPTSNVKTSTSGDKLPRMRAVWDKFMELGLTQSSRRPRGGGDDVTQLSLQQLDMAPARGARVERLRMKDRLCHRHVIIPEGPKYDSAGKVYLLPFRAGLRGGSRGGQGNYAVTHRPSLLLPSCCNCCKKSVLGCE